MDNKTFALQLLEHAYKSVLTDPQKSITVVHSSITLEGCDGRRISFEREDINNSSRYKFQIIVWNPLEAPRSLYNDMKIHARFEFSANLFSKFNSRWYKLYYKLSDLTKTREEETKRNKFLDEYRKAFADFGDEELLGKK